MDYQQFLEPRHLRLLAELKRSQSILEAAAVLGISEKTAQSYLSQIWVAIRGSATNETAAYQEWNKILSS